MDLAHELLKWTPAVVVLVAVLVAGARGYWYWGANARAVLDDTRQQRDEWRALALALLKEKGVTASADDGPPVPPHA